MGLKVRSIHKTKYIKRCEMIGMILMIAFGVYLGNLGHDYRTKEFWILMLMFSAYGFALRAGI